VRPTRAVFIDNTSIFVQIAESLGIHGILHKDCQSTRAKLIPSRTKCRMNRGM
jgi:hypothetical protein